MFWNRIVPAGIALFIIAGCGRHDNEVRRPLVKVMDIERYLESGKKIQIIDVRTEEEYAEGHIPGAHQIWRSDLEDRHQPIQGLRISREELAEKLGLIGIHTHDSIYLYDAKGNVDAARLWWLLMYYGFNEVAMIDGGYIQWRMASLPVEYDGMTFIPTIFNFPEDPMDELLAVKEDILEQKRIQIIDARSTEEYEGKLLKNGSLRGGHIPGAIHLDYMEMINGGAFTLHDKSHLLALLKGRNIDTDETTIVYCHSGVRSAFETFVFTEILGMEKVSNYDGSWVEWSADEALPINN